MNDQKARELVAGERARIEASLRTFVDAVRDEGSLERQQAGESNSGSELATEMVETAMVADLRAELAAVVRAEERIAAGTYGRSIESGLPIPDARLEAVPLAERTVEEQQRYDDGAR